MPPIGWPTAKEVDASIKRRTYDPKRYTGRSFCPITNHYTQVIEYWEEYGPQGKTQASALESDPNPVKMPKRIKKRFDPGYFREKVVITESDLLKLAMLSDEYKLMGIDGLVASALDVINTRKDNLIEWAIWQAVTAGQVSINENGVKFDATYGIPAANLTKFVSVLWSDSANAVPVKDLMGAMQYFRGTGFRLRDIKMNSYTLQQIIDAKDTKTYYAGAGLKEKVTQANVETWGPSFIPGTQWEINDTGYEDDSGTFQIFIPNNRVLLFGDAAPGEMMDFASVPSLQNGVPVPGPFAIPNYNHITDVPPKVEIFGGIFGLPRVKLPHIIFVLKTDATS